jgi:hypothetical protein
MTMQYNMSAERRDLNTALMDFNIDENLFIADKVMPVVDKNLIAGYYTVISAENNRTASNKASNGSVLNQITTSAEDAYYACQRYGLGNPVTKQDMGNYKDMFDAEEVAAQIVRTQMLNAKEIRVATEVFNTTTFAVGTGNFIDNKAAPWSTVGTDIISQVGAAVVALRTKCGFIPDSMVIGYGTMRNMLKNTGIINRFPGAPVITMQMIQNELASLLGLRNLYVGSAAYNSANEGQAYSGSDVWSNKYALVYRESTTQMQPGLGWQFNWTGNGEVAMGFSSYPDPTRQAVIIEEQEYRDEVIYDTGRYGYLMQIET